MFLLASLILLQFLSFIEGQFTLSMCLTMIFFWAADPYRDLYKDVGNKNIQISVSPLGTDNGH